MDTTYSSAAEDTQQELFAAANYHKKKVIAERILGSVLLIVAVPLIVLIVVLVRISSRGKGIYKQTRVGKDGRNFSIYKIRTMKVDAEACGNAQWSTPGDSRITRLGRVLRFLHLDELPQLANVALGHMSLIGPRPERPAFVAKLAPIVPNYLDRLAVLPGVTGLAQINLPADGSLESVRQKVVLDREYIQTATLALDLRIFCCTLFRMTGLRHGVAPRLFGVERSPEGLAQPSGDYADAMDVVISLDDTAINIPSLIASPPPASAAYVAQTEGQVACAAETVAADVAPSELESKATSPAPRRPR